VGATHRRVATVKTHARAASPLPRAQELRPARRSQRTVGMTLHVIHTLRAGIDKRLGQHGRQHLIITRKPADYPGAPPRACSAPHANSGLGAPSKTTNGRCNRVMETLELRSNCGRRLRRRRRRAGLASTSTRNRRRVGAVTALRLQWKLHRWHRAKLTAGTARGATGEGPVGYELVSPRCA